MCLKIIKGKSIPLGKSIFYKLLNQFSLYINVCCIHVAKHLFLYWCVALVPLCIHKAFAFVEI
jgi:hypothetical protein